MHSRHPSSLPSSTTNDGATSIPSICRGRLYDPAMRPRPTVKRESGLKLLLPLREVIGVAKCLDVLGLVSVSHPQLVLVRRKLQDLYPQMFPFAFKPPEHVRPSPPCPVSAGRDGHFATRPISAIVATDNTEQACDTAHSVCPSSQLMSPSRLD